MLKRHERRFPRYNVDLSHKLRVNGDCRTRVALIGYVLMEIVACNVHSTMQSPCYALIRRIFHLYNHIRFHTFSSVKIIINFQLTNSMAYRTQRFNVAFTSALQEVRGPVWCFWTRCFYSEGQIMEMKVVGRRRTQLFDDLRNRRRYLELKEEAVDRKKWKRQFIIRT